MKDATQQTILMIEDEAAFRQIYRDLLEANGFRVVEAADGQEGMKQVTSERPDLVLLDIVMPKFQGFEVLKKIRSRESTKELPVIVLSVVGELKHQQTAMKLGANGYFVKGDYSPDQLVAKIRGHLGKAS